MHVAGTPGREISRNGEERLCERTKDYEGFSGLLLGMCTEHSYHGLDESRRGYPEHL